MTYPHDITAEVTNLERELRDLGWRPVEMVDEESGLPFTRWFPPSSRAPGDELPLGHGGRSHNVGTEESV